MRLSSLGLSAAIAAMLALPAAAQQTQTPAKPPTAAAQQGTTATPSPRPPSTNTPVTGKQSNLVDINSASAQELDALPGIGKARADAIISNRPYKGKDDLLNRHILPPNVYNGIKDKVIARQG